MEKRASEGKLKIVLFSLIPAVVLLACGEIFAALSIQRTFEVARDPVTGQQYYPMRSAPVAARDRDAPQFPRVS